MTDETLRYQASRRLLLKEFQGRNLPLDCPECSGVMVLRYSPKNDGFFYGCNNYPECKATHGAHQHNGAPLGIPADKETKQWRIKAHEVFDKLWKGPGPTMMRHDAYRYVAGLLGIPSEDMHIARFSINDCKRLIDVLSTNNLVTASLSYPVYNSYPTNLYPVEQKKPEEEEDAENPFSRILDI